MNNRIYHYTKGNNIKSIISDGIIKLIRGFEDMGEQPIVSLTTNSVFEIGILPFEPENNSININQIIKGQNKMICLDQLPNYKRITDMKKAVEMSNGFYRIEVSNDIELLNWHGYKKYCRSKRRINEDVFKIYEEFLIECGSLYDSLFSLEPICEEDWLNIEKLDIGTKLWKDLDETDLKVIFNLKPEKSYDLLLHFPSKDINEIFNN